MFRALTRKQNMLSPQECTELLQQETRGVLSVLGDDEYPYGMPMNHWYDAEDGALYFHCGKGGYRLDCIRAHNKASFCVFNQGERSEGEWAWRVKSVIVFGRIEILDDRARIIDITTKLSRKFTQDAAYIQKEIESAAHKTLLLKLTPEHICGKRVTEA